MEYIFATILFLSIGALIVGVIKPQLVIKWKQEATRKDVLKTYSIAILVSFIMVAIFAPPVEQKVKQIDTVTKEPVPTISENQKFLDENIYKTNQVIISEYKGVIKKIAFAFAEENNISKSYHNTMYDCLADNIYSKSKDFNVSKMLEWCYDDYKQPIKGKKYTYFNQEILLEDFSPWDGAYRPLEKLIKDNMNDPSSYDHTKTMYRFVFYGAKRPHMLVTTEYRGKNAYGAIVKGYNSVKVDAKTKELFDIK